MPALAPLIAADVIAFHDRLLATAGWPQAEPAPPDGGLWRWIQTNHRNNCQLWAEEDLARRTTVAEAEIAANKRAIDRFNQARNDATERVDELLLLALGVVDEAAARSEAPLAQVAAGARLNSETAGSMVDRLSILSLKLQAMGEQTRRQDVDETHRAASRVKWERLAQQRTDLASCLNALLEETAAGKAYFKVYRQFKMYNDPAFNPELVKELRRP
jgi:Protein of unknown function (DUF4254)